MRIKLIIGWVLFGVGIILQSVSYITDIWVIRFIGGILWPIGMVMVVNTSIALKNNKRDTEKHNN